MFFVQEDNFERIFNEKAPFYEMVLLFTMQLETGRPNLFISLNNKLYISNVYLEEIQLYEQWF